MTTLYYATGACSLAPHIVLEWIGEPYEAVKVQFGSQELLAVNPAGAVPTLREDDGWLLTQAGAIVDYLTRKHPEAGLASGPPLREQAEAHRWSCFLTSDVHAAFWPIFLSARYTTDESAPRHATRSSRPAMHWWPSSSASSMPICGGATGSSARAGGSDQGSTPTPSR